MVIEMHPSARQDTAFPGPRQTDCHKTAANLKVAACIPFLFGFCVAATKIQSAQEVKLPDDSFSMEFPFEHAVPLNDPAKRALASDRAIADVMKDDGLAVDTIPKNWFTAAEVRLGPPGHTDLVVMGTGISVGPYSTGFWVLRQTKEGYEVVLSTNAHDLALLHTSTNGLRDIEAGLTTGGKAYKEIFKFDGRRYQKSRR